MQNEKQIKRNLAALENAIAQQNLEGLQPSSQVIAELKRVAYGEISIEDVLQGVKKRLANEQVLRSRSIS